MKKIRTNRPGEVTEPNVLRYLQALVARSFASLAPPERKVRTGQALSDHTRHFANAKAKRRRREKGRRQFNRRMRGRAR